MEDTEKPRPLCNGICEKNNGWCDDCFVEEEKEIGEAELLEKIESIHARASASGDIVFKELHEVLEVLIKKAFST